MFNKAVKTESKLRMAIAGPSGSGKTYTALAVAAALVPGGKVAVIDTEHGSASKYADIFTFDVAPAAPPYHPDGLIKLVNYAAANGYDVIIIDSLSHYWSGAGGVLDLKEDAERKMRNPNGYTAWRDVTPVHQHMVDSLIATNAHVIATMRSKQDYILVEKNGKQVPQKVGMAPIQRDGVEYEFDVLLDMDIENVGRVQKTRCPALTGAAIVKPGADIANILRDWLHGAPPPPMKQFTDGSFVPANAVTHYDAYVAVHDGHAPENVAALREWFKAQKNGNGKATTKAQFTPSIEAQLADDGNGNSGGGIEQPFNAQDDLFGAEYDARQEELKAAALETARNG